MHQQSDGGRVWMGAGCHQGSEPLFFVGLCAQSTTALGNGRCCCTKHRPHANASIPICMRTKLTSAPKSTSTAMACSNSKHTITHARAHEESMPVP